MQSSYKMIGAICVLLLTGVSAQAATALVRVPSIGCKSDGQMGPQPAPESGTVVLRIDTAVAGKLAYYKTQEGPGVLGPRGWSCFGLYGSNGETIIVTPQPWPDGKDALTGPAIQLSVSIGDTSGRFEVARYIARLFPAQRKFADDVINEKLEPAADFPFGPYPQDRLTNKGARLVEYETPAHADGMGTQSRLVANAEPIRGFVELVGEETSAWHLSVRLPPGMAPLADVIIRQAKK